jgi:hypothetical protein
MFSNTIILSQKRSYGYPGRKQLDPFGQEMSLRCFEDFAKTATFPFSVIRSAHYLRLEGFKVNCPEI